MDEYPYGEKKWCSKCNHDSYTVKFCVGEDECNCHLIKTAEDHLEHTCNLCGFTWAVRTKDNFA